MKSCFFAAYESAWNKGHAQRTDRAVVRAGLPARMRWLVDLRASGRRQWPRIACCAFGCVRLGVTLAEPSAHSSVSVVVDFLVGGRLIIEVDGRENHDGASMRHKDLVARCCRGCSPGYETLRFDYALVMHDWPTVEQAIVTAVCGDMRVRSRRAGL